MVGLAGARAHHPRAVLQTGGSVDALERVSQREPGSPLVADSRHVRIQLGRRVDMRFSQDHAGSETLPVVGLKHGEIQTVAVDIEEVYLPPLGPIGENLLEPTRSHYDSFARPECLSLRCLDGRERSIEQERRFPSCVGYRDAEIRVARTEAPETREPGRVGLNVDAVPPAPVQEQSVGGVERVVSAYIHVETGEPVGEVFGQPEVLAELRVRHSPRVADVG